MAIVKTTTVQRCEVYPLQNSDAENTANAKHASLMVVYNDSMDDADDADLPVTATRVKHIYKFVEDGGDATDVSGEDALVQTICAAIWA
ncbi:hypothetical protein N9X62_00055 [Candidatus Poseidoniales archaeon]|jgi:hypothetical protein|nr:hypothetical protein [Candidatus Poseidoniales archaeon]